VSATNGSAAKPCILYCHCAYAKVVPEDVKREVLQRLDASGAAYEAVPDLCEMSARKDPALARFAREGELRMAACYPRAVKWLFHAAGADLQDESVSVGNMRDEDATTVVERLLAPGVAQ
jgi:hypothetical protein